MTPDPYTVFPVAGCDTVTYVKPTVTNPNIIVGDFTYFSDVDFEKHVLHHYDFIGDKLIIGKFCQIASGVTFIMNGANHQMNSASTYPFYIMTGWTDIAPKMEDLPMKGDTVIGNDVSIGIGSEVPNKMKPNIYSGGLATIGENSVIPGGVQIGKNTAISGVTSSEDYIDGVLASGETLIKAGDRV